MTTRKESFRIKIVDPLKNVSYVVRKERAKGQYVDYISSSETPLALSNMFGHNAAELRFFLQDCTYDREAYDKIRKLIPHCEVTIVTETGINISPAAPKKHA